MESSWDKVQTLYRPVEDKLRSLFDTVTMRSESYLLLRVPNSTRNIND